MSTTVNGNSKGEKSTLHTSERCTWCQNPNKVPTARYPQTPAAAGAPYHPACDEGGRALDRGLRAFYIAKGIIRPRAVEVAA